MEEEYFEVTNTQAMVGGIVTGSILFIAGIVLMIVFFVNENLESKYGFIFLAFALLGLGMLIAFACLLRSAKRKYQKINSYYLTNQ